MRLIRGTGVPPTNRIAGINHITPLWVRLAILTSRVVQTVDTEPLLELLAGANVPASRIYQSKDMFDDPHFRAREAIVRLTHDRLGPFPVQAVVPVCPVHLAPCAASAPSSASTTRRSTAACSASPPPA